MNKRKVFWHEAHFEALKLELHEYRDALSFVSEHQLSKEACKGAKCERSGSRTKTYDNLFGLDMRNVYIDRFIQANKNVFKEAACMSEGLKRILYEVAEENGWLDEWLRENRQTVIAATGNLDAKEIARQLLNFGDPVEKIAAVTNFLLKR